jgi:hypothetical protein
MTEERKVDVDLYSIDKLMHETRQLAAKYREATGTSLPVTGEIARFDVAKALNLSLIEDSSSAIDAVGLEGELKGKRVVIKGRAIFDDSKASPRIGQLNPEQDWDYVALVLFDDQYEPEEIYLSAKADIVETLEGKRESNRKKRGAMSIAQFKIISERVWTRENGLEEQTWDNQEQQS